MPWRDQRIKTRGTGIEQQGDGGPGKPTG
jgi:hypothetical protein